MRHGRHLVLLIGLLAGLSCTPREKPAPSPSPRTLQQAPIARPIEPPARYRTSVLLDFENDHETAFVVSEGAAVTDGSADSGWKALSVPGRAAAKVKLASLLRGRTFPGDWTLLGVSARSAVAQRVDVALRADGQDVARRAVELKADTWTPIALSLTAAPEKLVGTLTLEISSDSDLLIDRVALVDDSRIWVESTGDEGWEITQRGHQVKIASPHRFELIVPTPERNPDGWTIVEAGALRAVLKDAVGERVWTLYPDGRAYRDGEYAPIQKLPEVHNALASAHVAPAEIYVAEEQGRVDRTTPGDANNDGYNECLGAYQVRATAPVVAVKFVPRALVVLPVIEIAGLPEGDILVTIEGRLIDRMARLENGVLLIDLPVKFERPVTVEVRVK